MFIKNLKISGFFITFSLIFNILAIYLLTQVRDIYGLISTGICCCIMISCIIFSIVYLRKAWNCKYIDEFEESE